MSPVHDRPAPGPLEEVRHLLNTDDRFHRVDHARDVGALNAFLVLTRSTWGPLPESADLQGYRAFRDTARELLLRPTARSRAAFNDVAGTHPMVTRVEEDSVRLSPPPGAHTSAVDAMLGDAVALVHHAMLTGDWDRLDECEREDCRWIYYDPAPARGTRWCSTDPCGNVMKVRAYRARRKTL